MGMTRNLRKRLAQVAIGAILVAGTAGAGAYASGQLENGSDPTFPEQPTRAAATSVDESLSSAFSVLRRDRDQGDALPNPEHSNVGEHGAPYGANLALARKSRDDGGMSFFVIPGNDSVCLEATGPDPLSGVGGGCARTAQAVDGYMVRIVLTRGGIRIMGLLPDGAADVRAVLASGERVQIPVVNNVYTTEVGESLAAIEFTINGEQRKLQTPFEMAHLGQEQDGKVVRIR